MIKTTLELLKIEHKELPDGFPGHFRQVNTGMSALWREKASGGYWYVRPDDRRDTLAVAKLDAEWESCE